MRQLVLALALLVGCGHDGATSDDASTADGAPTADAPRGAPDPCIAANTCTPGTWIDVTPAAMTIPEFGPGPVVVDPVRPTDLYVAGGGAGVWKSTDYGNTWTQSNTDLPYVPMGLVLAVVGTQPAATVLVAGEGGLYKSTDGGATFTLLPNTLPAELYSLEIDPYDDQHLISGLHEMDGLVESTDGGATWTPIASGGFPAGGISWYPFFLDTGSADTTRGSWLAIAQDGGSVAVTRDGGGSWTIPDGIAGLQHAHGNAQIIQHGRTVLVPGISGTGDVGQGVFRSDALGASFTKVLDGAYSVAWGTEANAYAMWGWACAACDLGAGFSIAALSDTATWTKPDVPAALNIGANHVAVTHDADHAIFVGTAWSTGIWKYVEP